MKSEGAATMAYQLL